MNKSDTITKLAEALSKAQAEMPAVKFNATNPFLKNKYADLGAIIETAQPVLAKHGLAVSQLNTSSYELISAELASVIVKPPVEDNKNTPAITLIPQPRFYVEQVGVETILLHSSGEYISSTMSMIVEAEKGKSTAQVAGSIITYLRRYSLAAILGMYADQDGDGNAAKAVAKPEGKPLTMAEGNKMLGYEDEDEPKPQPALAETGEPMTLEAACAMTNSKGIQYGTMPENVLEKIISNLYKTLNTSGLADEDKAVAERKVKAAKMVYDSKKAQEIA